MLAEFNISTKLDTTLKILYIQCFPRDRPWLTPRRPLRRQDNPSGNTEHVAGSENRIRGGGRDSLFTVTPKMKEVGVVAM